MKVKKKRNETESSGTTSNNSSSHSSTSPSSRMVLFPSSSPSTQKRTTRRNNDSNNSNSNSKRSLNFQASPVPESSTSTTCSLFQSVLQHVHGDTTTSMSGTNDHPKTHPHYDDGVATHPDSHAPPPTTHMTPPVRTTTTTPNDLPNPNPKVPPQQHPTTDRIDQEEDPSPSLHDDDERGWKACTHFLTAPTTHTFGLYQTIQTTTTRGNASFPTTHDFATWKKRTYHHHHKEDPCSTPPPPARHTLMYTYHPSENHSPERWKEAFRDVFFHHVRRSKSHNRCMYLLSKTGSIYIQHDQAILSSSTQTLRQLLLPVLCHNNHTSYGGNTIARNIQNEPQLQDYIQQQYNNNQKNRIIPHTTTTNHHRFLSPGTKQDLEALRWSSLHCPTNMSVAPIITTNTNTTNIPFSMAQQIRSHVPPIHIQGQDQVLYLLEVLCNYVSSNSSTATMSTTAARTSFFTILAPVPFLHASVQYPRFQPHEWYFPYGISHDTLCQMIQECIRRVNCNHPSEEPSARMLWRVHAWTPEQTEDHLPQGYAAAADDPTLLGKPTLSQSSPFFGTIREDQVLTLVWDPAYPTTIFYKKEIKDSDTAAIHTTTEEEEEESDSFLLYEKDFSKVLSLS